MSLPDYAAAWINLEALDVDFPSHEDGFSEAWWRGRGYKPLKEVSKEQLVQIINQLQDFRDPALEEMVLWQGSNQPKNSIDEQVNQETPIFNVDTDLVFVDQMSEPIASVSDKLDAILDLDFVKTPKPASKPKSKPNGKPPRPTND